MKLAFIDTETTGLDPDQHQIWEVAAIVDNEEYEWVLPVDLGRADAFALKLNGYHERAGSVDRTMPVHFAEEFAELTRGRHLVGAVPSFDAERLTRLLRSNGACPEWHYHLIDVEALAIGYLAGSFRTWELERIGAQGKWDSQELTAALGVELPDERDRHTALGDARWAKRVYEAVMGDVTLTKETT